jgi:hypothetical protein
MLSVDGCPTTPEQPGLTRAELNRDYGWPRCIHNWYTLPDLAAEVGRRDSLFSRQGFWGRVG